MRSWLLLMCGAGSLLGACVDVGSGPGTDDEYVRLFSVDSTTRDPNAEFIAARRIDLEELQDPVFGLSEAYLLPFGEVLVVDWGQHRSVRIREDATSNRIGRRGEGPGEFMSIGPAGILEPDSVIFFDSRLRRFSIFHLSGALGRTFSPDWLSDGSTIEGIFSVVGGLLLALKPPPDSDLMQALMEQPARDSIRLGVMDRVGRLILQPALTIPDRRRQATTRGDAYSLEAVPAGLAALIAPTAEGVVVGTNVSRQLEFWPWTQLGSSDARLLGADAGTEHAEARFGTVIADGCGGLWLTESRVEGSLTRRWYRISLEGTVLDVLEMPRTHGLLDARGDTLLVRTELVVGDIDLLIGSVVR